MPPSVAAPVVDLDSRNAWSREKHSAWVSPSLSASVPTGFGSEWGTVYAGIGFVSRVLLTNIADGGAFLGFGIGNANKWVALDTSFILANLDPIFADGSIAFRLWRYLSTTSAVSIGIDNALVWGGILAATRYYIAASKIFELKDSNLSFSSLGIHLGVWSGQSRNFVDGTAGPWVTLPTASIGVRILPPVGLSAGWTGEDLDFCLSLTPFRSLRLSVNMTLLSTLRLKGDGNVLLVNVSFGDSVFSRTFPFLAR